MSNFERDESIKIDLESTEYNPYTYGVRTMSAQCATIYNLVSG